MISIKKGAVIRGVRPEILIALMIANEVYDEEDLPCRLTEVTGGKHSQASLHYVGQAIDLGIRDYRSEIISGERKATLVSRLRERLGDEYDIVSEVDHIHCEFQPK